MKRLIPLLLLVLMACQPNTGISTNIPVSATAATLTVPTATDTVTPIAIPTPAVDERYTINYLRGRTYGDGNIKLVKTLERQDTFTRYLFRYPSDGLVIYGFANVPKGAGPFPIIIALHGYVKTDEYQTLDYTTDAADNLTQNGYIVLHPNLRNYPPSDTGDDLFRVGMAVDVLNLIELVKSGAGPAKLFNAAARDQIGLWGHSLGGNVVLRVLTVSKDIKAAVLFASLSGDESKNARLMWNITTEPIYEKETKSSPESLQSISPVNYYKYIIAPVQLYHGTADTVVPLEWAKETCTQLGDAGVTINCIYFPGEDHTFRSRVSGEFNSTLLDFYKKYLSP